MPAPWITRSGLHFLEVYVVLLTGKKMWCGYAFRTHHLAHLNGMVAVNLQRVRAFYPLFTECRHLRTRQEQSNELCCCLRYQRQEGLGYDSAGDFGLTELQAYTNELENIVPLGRF